MKKIIISGLALILFALPAPSVEFSTIAALVPADVDRYVETARLYRVHQLAGPFAVDHLDRNAIKEILGEIYPYLIAADINPLSLYSLAEGGVDARRPAGFARFDRYGKRNGFLLFIPVLNTSRAAQVFVEVQNRVAVIDNKNEIQPVFIDYRGVQIFRMGRERFFGIINGYLVISNLADLLKETVNLSFDNRGSFSMQEVYGFWDAGAGSDDIVRIYAKTNTEFDEAPGSDNDFIRARIRLRGSELYYSSTRGARSFAEMETENNPDPALRRLVTIRDGALLCPECSDREKNTRALLEIFKPLTGSGILSLVMDSSFRLSAILSRDGEKKDEPLIGALFTPGDVFGEKEFRNLVAAMKKEFSGKGETVALKAGQSANFMRGGTTVFTVAHASGKLLMHSGDRAVPLPFMATDDEKPVSAIAGEGSIESTIALFGLKGKAWEALASRADRASCASGPSILSLALHMKKTREK